MARGMMRLISLAAAANCAVCSDEPAIVLLQTHAEILQTEEGAQPFQWFGDKQLKSMYSIEAIKELLQSGALATRPNPDVPAWTQYRIRDEKLVQEIMQKVGNNSAESTMSVEMAKMQEQQEAEQVRIMKEEAIRKQAEKEAKEAEQLADSEKAHQEADYVKQDPAEVSAAQQAVTADMQGSLNKDALRDASTHTVNVANQVVEHEKKFETLGSPDGKKNLVHGVVGDFGKALSNYTDSMVWVVDKVFDHLTISL